MCPSEIAGAPHGFTHSPGLSPGSLDPQEKGCAWERAQESLPWCVGHGGFSSWRKTWNRAYSPGASLLWSKILTPLERTVVPSPLKEVEVHCGWGQGRIKNYNFWGGAREHPEPNSLYWYQPEISCHWGKGKRSRKTCLRLRLDQNRSGPPVPL